MKRCTDYRNDESYIELSGTIQKELAFLEVIQSDDPDLEGKFEVYIRRSLMQRATDLNRELKNALTEEEIERRRELLELIEEGLGVEAS